eukprot:524755-Pleurochrysis_carterae.AAC.1
MEGHYSLATREISRSFVVGPLNDCCCASAGLAKGVAFGTFARALADIRLARPMREGRNSARERKESKETIAIETWIQRSKDGMEGSKGREACDVWHTAKLPTKKRWNE